MNVLTLTICLFLALLSHAHAGANKEVRDWYVWCDDVLNCTMQTGDGNEVYGFGFTRSPKANSEVSLFLSTALKPKRGSRIVAIFEGDESREFVLEMSQAKFEEGVWKFPGQNPDNRLLNAMMAGKSMTLVIVTEDGDKRVPVSLSGVTGSALFMDEAQERVGNRDALQAKGDGDPKDVVTRVTLLNSTRELPSGVVNFWKQNTDYCAETLEPEQDLIEDFGGSRIGVDDGAEMYILPCGSPGAYNLPQVLLIQDVNSKQVRRLYLPVMGQKGPTLMDSPYNLNWDDRRSLLSSFFKGRGLGDCGVRSVWSWQGGYNSNFELLEEYVKENCDGKYDDWPQIWPPQ